MRAIWGQPSRTMKPITGQMVELVTTERKTSPPSTTGMPKKTSVTRDSTASHLPPKNPARPPRTPPSSETPTVDRTPTATEVRAP